MTRMGRPFQFSRREPIQPVASWRNQFFIRVIRVICGLFAVFGGTGRWARKFQAPSPKLQRNTKAQIPMVPRATPPALPPGFGPWPKDWPQCRATPPFEAWSFFGTWELELLPVSGLQHPPVRQLLDLGPKLQGSQNPRLPHPCPSQIFGDSRPFFPFSERSAGLRPGVPPRGRRPASRFSGNTDGESDSPSVPSTLLAGSATSTPSRSECTETPTSS